MITLTYSAPLQESSISVFIVSNCFLSPKSVTCPLNLPLLSPLCLLAPLNRAHASTLLASAQLLASLVHLQSCSTSCG